MSVTGNPGPAACVHGLPRRRHGRSGYIAALSIASALYGRRVTGEGRRLDISLLDVQIAFQAHLGQFYLVSGEVPQPIGSGHPSNLPVGAYRCSDGRYPQVHCASQEFAMKTLRMMSGEVAELQGMDEDPRFTTAPARIENRGVLEAALTAGFATLPRHEWEERLLKWDVPGGPVNDIGEALTDPQVLLRNMVVDIDHPVAGNLPHGGKPDQGRQPRLLFAAADTGAGHRRRAHRPAGLQQRRGGCLAGKGSSVVCGVAYKSAAGRANHYHRRPQRGGQDHPRQRSSCPTRRIYPYSSMPISSLPAWTR